MTNEQTARFREIGAALTEVLGHPKLGKPKTKRSIRDIPIPHGLKVVLAAHKKDQMAEFAACGNRWSPTGPVFATLFGAYTVPSNLVRACKNVFEWSHAGSVQRRRYSGKLDFERQENRESC
jgi:hypothetical protein